VNTESLDREQLLPKAPRAAAPLEHIEQPGFKNAAAACAPVELIYLLPQNR